MKKNNSTFRLDSIAEVHRSLGLPQPVHPMVTLLDNTAGQIDISKLPKQDVLSFYKIIFITKLSGKLKYGQGYYDFDEGSLLFAAPSQIIGQEDHSQHVGYALLIHPDFLQGYPLVTKIGLYGFFSYMANEALHLSAREKSVMLSLFKIIEEELSSRIDDFSQDVVIAQLELLLSYANRFYKRQFITRKAINNDLLQRLEQLLNEYFNDEESLMKGIPTVHYLAQHLHLSPRYLSDMLRSLTGQNAQQHIHEKLIAKAKEKLSTTELSVSEIAYQLGFEHPQSFSKLFKIKTNYTPIAFRRLFN